MSFVLLTAALGQELRGFAYSDPNTPLSNIRVSVVLEDGSKKVSGLTHENGYFAVNLESSVPIKEICLIDENDNDNENLYGHILGSLFSKEGEDEYTVIYALMYPDVNNAGAATGCINTTAQALKDVGELDEVRDRYLTRLDELAVIFQDDTALLALIEETRNILMTP